MPSTLVRYHWPATAAASVALLSNNNVAQAAARAPQISSGGWVALGIIAFLVWAIYLLVRGALSEERRSRRDHGWFGVMPTHDDDDTHLHPLDGGGGEGGN